MRLGFFTAILPELSLEEVVAFAAAEGFECLEVACWPKMEADRRYAGITHIDVGDFTDADAAKVKALCERHGIAISALGYYPNPLCADEKEAGVYIEHIKKMISAARRLGISIANTFVGRDHTRSAEDNWPVFEKRWPGIIAHAEKCGIRVGIENCPMSFTADEWPGGKNLANCPKQWREMFRRIPSRHFGLNYDPSHAVWQFMHSPSARSLGMGMRRVQCTPDLMPGDVLGANIFDFRTQSFTLTKGPVFTEFLLADEINRTPPKTQSSLLEAMQERSVTIDGVTHALSERFLVMATQNPVEHEGTYPLPEAQLDRFLFKLELGYPSAEQEVSAVLAHGDRAGMPDLDALGVEALTTGPQVDELRRLVPSIRLEPKVAQYVVELVRSTREHPSLAVGLSPRAATSIAAAARASAACAGRDFVIPDDVKALFVAAARHRVIVTPAAEMEDVRTDDVLREVVSRVAPPR